MVELLQEALDHGGNTHSIDDVLTMIHDRRAELWCGAGSAVVTELVDYPQLKALRVWLVAGDINEIRSMEPKVTEFARQHGAKRLEIGGGRPGWERVLRDWRKLCPCAVKEI